MISILKIKLPNGEWIEIPAIKGADGTVSFDELTEAQKALLKGEKGDKGDKGETGANGLAFTYEDFTPEQLALLKGEKGDKGDTFVFEDLTSEQLGNLKALIYDKKQMATAQYLTLVGNVNTDMVESAFGKNNEDNIKNVGMALALYARYYDTSINIEESFPNLITCDSVNDILNSTEAKTEMFSDSGILNLVYNTAYINDKLVDVLVEETADVNYAASSYSYSINRNITVTDEMLARNDLAIYSCIDIDVNNEISARIVLNGVATINLPLSSSQVGNYSDIQHLQFTDFNITTAGTYDLTFYSYCTKAHGTYYNFKILCPK